MKDVRSQHAFLIATEHHIFLTNLSGCLVWLSFSGLQRLFHTMRDFYCVFLFRDLQQPVSVEAQYEVIYPSTLWAKEYTAHWILCPLSNQLIRKFGAPVSVTVLPSACDPEPTFMLPVQAKSYKNSKQNQRTNKQNQNLNLPRGNEWHCVYQHYTSCKIIGPVLQSGFSSTNN